MESEILPCPFCGSRCAARGAVGSRWVYCTDDDVCGYVGTEGPDAIAAHNTVAAAVRDHAAVVAERDALRAQVAQLREAFGTGDKGDAAAHENTPCDPRYGCVVCAAAAALAATAPGEEATDGG